MSSEADLYDVSQGNKISLVSLMWIIGNNAFHSNRDEPINLNPLEQAEQTKRKRMYPEKALGAEEE